MSGMEMGILEWNDLLLMIAVPLGIAGAGLGIKVFAEVRGERDRATVMQNDLRALCSAAVNMGERINQLEQRLQQLSLRQDELGLQQTQDQGDSSSFAQAAKLVHKGASAEELVEICGLSLGEAELLTMMHRLGKKKE